MDSPSNLLSGARIAALVDDRFEQSELSGPKAAYELAGARVDVISRHVLLTGVHHGKICDQFVTDVALAEAEPNHYDALLLPGGVANSDSLRVVTEAREFAREIVRHNKPVAVICHGGWLLISAGLVRNRTLTSWPSLQDDFRNAGAQWVDREVVEDGNWVSSRKPEDIPAFSRASVRIISRYMGEVRHPKAA